MDGIPQLGNETAGPSPLLVSIREAAATLNVGRTTIYSLIDRGEIVPVHVGRCLRFRPEDLRAFVDRLANGSSKAERSDTQGRPQPA